MTMEEDNIDFTKLEREFQTAVEKDDKYARENAAKFRAVEQRVGSYEEFRDIVLASHLKPLDKKDITGQKERKQPFNALCTTNIKANIDEAGMRESKALHAMKTSTSQPNSADDFIRAWKKLSSNSDERYTYLVNMETLNIKNILVSEIVGNVLGEIAIQLEKCFCFKDADKIMLILEHLQLSKRFTLSLQFLSRMEKEALNGLFRKLNDSVANKQTIDSLKGSYELI